MTRRAANYRQRLNTVTNDGKYATADEAGYTSLLAANLNMLVDRQSGLRSGLKTYSCPFRIPGRAGGQQIGLCLFQGFACSS